MDKAIRDARVVAAAVVWGAELERAANTAARHLAPGLNFRDLLLLRIVFAQDAPTLPSVLVGPAYTTTAGVAGSLDRLEAAGLVSRSTGDDQRTHPVTVTEAGSELAVAIVEPWAGFVDGRLSHLDEPERAELYRLLIKGSDVWAGIWSEDEKVA